MNPSVELPVGEPAGSPLGGTATAEPPAGEAGDRRPFARELDRRGLERALAPHFPRDPGRHAAEIAAALYRERALDREEIVARARLGRERLRRVEEALRLGPLLSPVRTVRSDGDGCTRLVLSVNRLGGSELIEAVAIPRRGDLALCISTQAGCALRCAFCATGRIGFRANLSPGEIVEQETRASRLAGRRVTDVVFMGMGEPLLNYDAVLDAAYRLGAAEGAQISPRRIVISTAGIVPGIRRYARERHPFQLFFSLNSAIPEKRARLMPVEQRFPLDELRQAILEYLSARARNRFATLEYVLIPEENMSRADVEALGRFVSGLPAIVDVIPYNAAGTHFRPPTWAEVKAFTTALRKLGVPVKVRYSSGKSVAAGCGQLTADRIRIDERGGHMDAPPGIFSDL